MKKYIFTLNDLSDCLSENKRIVIYGAGIWGRQLIDYIFSVEKQDVVKGIAVTDKTGNISEYRGIKVYEASELFRQENCFILVAVSNRYLEDVRKTVERYRDLSQYSCITGDLISSMQDRRKRVEWNGKIDFLVPGFLKCGTTSIYCALKKFSDIYLSSKKENHYFEWCDNVEEPFKVLGDVYFNDIKEGQIVGIVEASYTEKAQRIYNTFGGDIRLVFMLRNPVNGAFSDFMMMCRDGSPEIEEAYQKYNGTFSVEMFDEYIKYQKSLEYDNFNYAHWISEFMNYYPREQIKTVFLEELLRNPREEMNSILKFIGSANEYDADELPRVNEGKYVMADIEGYRSTRQKTVLAQELRGTRNSDGQFNEKYEEYVGLYMKENTAKKLYDIKILPEQRKKTESYYYDSVRNLEKLLGKDLSKLWFYIIANTKMKGSCDVLYL